MKRLMVRVFPVAAVVAGVAIVFALRAEKADSHVTVEVTPLVEIHAEHAEHADHVRDSESHQTFECGDGNMETRLAALNALITMDTDKAMPILISVLERRDDCSAELRRKAVFLVSQHETDETDDLLYNAARTDPDFGVREQAIFWLGQEGSREDVEFLMDLFDDLESSELKEKVIFSVSQASHSAGGEWLMSLARDESESVEVRKNALFWAGQEGNVDAIELGDLYENAGDRDLQEHVIFVLSQIDGSEDATTVLIDIAKSESNSDLRDKALFWLGESRDPSAAKFLSDLINR